VGRTASLLLLAGVLGSVGVSGCTAGRAGEGPSSDTRVITIEQLRAVSASSAYDAVERLRPLWLRSQGPRSRSPRLVTEIVVVADGNYFGNVGSLRGIPAESVNGMRYLSGSEATNAYPWLATGRHVESAIVVYQGTRVP
jgi:hypothetical protein